MTAYIAGIPLLAHDEANAARQFLAAELEHTGQLIGLIPAAGAMAARSCRSYQFGHPRDRPAEVMTLLHSLESQQIAFYLQRLPQLSPAPVRAAVSTILTSDAQHIVVLRLAQGKMPAPSAFVTGAE